MRTLTLACLLAALPCLAQPTVEEILKRVAENQDKAADARKTVVYRQDTFVRLLRTNGKMSREEKRQYTVMPDAKGTEKKLDKFEGRYERGGKILSYEKPDFQYKDTDIDGELIEDLTDDMINDKKSRDGISKDLFPLTKDEQSHYTFKLDGTRKVGAVEAYRVTFEPRKEDASRCWAGEALIHPEEFQPMVVTTRFSMKIPRAVKIIFGIDIKQLGFNVSYRKVDEGLWFPSTYGTEFGIKVLFGYKRNITMSLKNDDFRRTTAESSIVYEAMK
ncbi:hypothetical protein [uncultured Paludibaculum sp.]|uniref:hypothetical protein n=1 Tax=uncultured Paludibaculum sp. TaxID=1765020 RepID=UPI002AAADEDD|nr:hypothetical protein [uncultured Paludibaculum sp.]